MIRAKMGKAHASVDQWATELRVFFWGDKQEAVEDILYGREGQAQMKRFINLLAILWLITGCGKEKQKYLECIEILKKEGLVQDGKVGHYKMVLSHLHDYKKHFGNYPDSLTQLSKLDSTDYSYMITSWKLGYRSLGQGTSFELNSYPESAVDSLVKGYELNRTNAIQTMNRMEECMVTR